MLWTMCHLERARVVSLRIKPTGSIDRASRDNARIRQLPGFLAGDVREVAAGGYRACRAGKVITVPGMLNQAWAVAGRTMPKWLLCRIGGLFGRQIL